MIFLSFWPFYLPHLPPFTVTIDFTGISGGGGCCIKFKMGEGVLEFSGQQILVYEFGGRWGRLGGGVFDSPPPIVCPDFIDSLRDWGEVNMYFHQKKN